jgi:hypothetical protein
LTEAGRREVFVTVVDHSNGANAIVLKAKLLLADNFNFVKVDGGEFRRNL